MKATFVDLRVKSAEILEALNRNESVTVYYRGQPKAVMQPLVDSERGPEKAERHPAFGLWRDRDDMGDVREHVRTIRRGRFDAR
jgi:hypothetical protein